MISRRHFLLGFAAFAGSAFANAPLGGRPIRLAASWQTEHGNDVGILRVGSGVRIESALRVPTRAHAIVVERNGGLLAVARRPGDWLLRIGFDAHGRVRARTWRWIEAQRSFNGHAIVSADGTRVYTTETDHELGSGIVGVRDAATLEKIDEWPTHGRDPHEIVWLGNRTRPTIAVANGGITTERETGRIKHDLDRMDASLTSLDAHSGNLLAQWNTADARLSLRHLAARGGTLAVALQAEHEDEAARNAAPVLALCDGTRLRAVDAPIPLRGYAGAVVSTADGFAVSCPRAGGVALYDADGRWLRFVALAEACALASDGGALWIGGESRALRASEEESTIREVRPQITIDNHWALLRSA